jgi:hypothetical protein
MNKEQLLSIKPTVRNGRVFLSSSHCSDAAEADQICEAIKGLQHLALNPPRLRELSEDIESERAASMRIVSDMISESVEGGKEITKSDATKWLILLTESL